MMIAGCNLCLQGYSSSKEWIPSFFLAVALIEAAGVAARDVHLYFVRSVGPVPLPIQLDSFNFPARALLNDRGAKTALILHCDYQNTFCLESNFPCYNWLTVGDEQSFPKLVSYHANYFCVSLSEIYSFMHIPFSIICQCNIHLPPETQTHCVFSGVDQCPVLWSSFI